MTTSRMKRGFPGRRNWPCTTDITWQHLQLSGGSRARPPQRHPGGGSAGAAADEDRVTGIESRARHWPHRSRSSASASLLARPLASRRPATRHGIPRPASNRGCPGIAHNEPPSRRTRRLRASLPVILSDRCTLARALRSVAAVTPAPKGDEDGPVVIPADVRRVVLALMTTSGYGALPGIPGGLPGRPVLDEGRRGVRPGPAVLAGVSVEPGRHAWREQDRDLHRPLLAHDVASPTSSSSVYRDLLYRLTTEAGTRNSLRVPFVGKWCHAAPWPGAAPRARHRRPGQPRHAGQLLSSHCRAGPRRADCRPHRRSDGTAGQPETRKAQRGRETPRSVRSFAQHGRSRTPLKPEPGQDR